MVQRDTRDEWHRELLVWPQAASQLAQSHTAPCMLPGRGCHGAGRACAFQSRRRQVLLRMSDGGQQQHAARLSAAVLGILRGRGRTYRVHFSLHVCEFCGLYNVRKVSVFAVNEEALKSRRLRESDLV